MTKAIFRRALLLTTAILSLLDLSLHAADHPYQYFPAGNPNDVQAKTRPGFALMGRGDDLDVAFQWMCDRAPGGDFLVLRASGDDDYNPYIQNLCKPNSVGTLILKSRVAVNDPFVAATSRGWREYCGRSRCAT